MRYMRSSGCNRPSLISRRTRTNLPASSRPPGRSPNWNCSVVSAWRTAGPACTGKAIRGDESAGRAPLRPHRSGRQGRPATDNTVEADVADLRQRCHLVPQKRGARSMKCSAKPLRISSASTSSARRPASSANVLRKALRSHSGGANEGGSAARTSPVRCGEFLDCLDRKSEPGPPCAALGPVALAGRSAMAERI